jgi:hypothetical protein
VLPMVWVITALAPALKPIRKSLHALRSQVSHYSIVSHIN